MYKDTIMPYVLASMHPVLHASLLLSSLIMTNTDDFYVVPKADQCKDKTALAFIGDQKYSLISSIQAGHIVAIVLHLLSSYCIDNEYRVLGNFCMLGKVFAYVVLQFVVQSGIMFKECRDGIVDDSQVMAWLSYEVLAFYLNIVAMALFMLFNGLFRIKFRSIKDRQGLLPESRKSQDFLTYCKDDLHWFCLWFTQLSLCILALTQRTKEFESIQWCCGLLFTRHVLEFAVISQYYVSDKFTFNLFAKVLLFSAFALNCGLIKLFIDLEDEHSTWWAPVLLQDIVLHFFMFALATYEWALWDKHQLDW